MGADMLGNNISFLIRAVVKQHHERWDGSGYPEGLAGDGIHQFARIAAVADVYDAVTSERIYKAPMKPHEGVAIINQGEGTDFDPEVVSVFSRVVMPFPPGSEVELADGRIGLVVDVDPRSPYEPTVRVRQDTGSIIEIERALLAVPVTV
jgi:HD-GYP domain-containing protein (c-di-GMP phosphodiesterase class II)